MTYFEDTQDSIDRMVYLSEQEELDVRDAWQNERAEQADRFVDESDVDRPDDTLIFAAGGHVYWQSSPRHPDWL